MIELRIRCGYYIILDRFDFDRFIKSLNRNLEFIIYFYCNAYIFSFFWGGASGE